MARVVDLAASGMAASCDMTPRILIADDQPDLLDALKLLLKGQGIEYDAVTSPDAEKESQAPEMSGTPDFWA